MDLTNIANIITHLGTIRRTTETEYPSFFFNRIEFNDFNIQFFAGKKALCEPAVDYDLLTSYNSIQLCILEIIKESEGAISPSVDERFSGFGWTKYFSYQTQKGQTRASFMAERVPLAEVPQIIRDVYKISRLKIFF